MKRAFGTPARNQKNFVKHIERPAVVAAREKRVYAKPNRQQLRSGFYFEAETEIDRVAGGEPRRNRRRMIRNKVANLLREHREKEARTADYVRRHPEVVT